MTVAFRVVRAIARQRRIVKSTLKTTPSTVSRNLKVYIMGPMKSYACYNYERHLNITCLEFHT